MCCTDNINAGADKLAHIQEAMDVFVDEYARVDVMPPAAIQARASIEKLQGELIHFSEEKIFIAQLVCFSE